MRKTIRIWGAAVVLAALATACDPPPPPPPTLTVDSVGGEPDATPGDGACATAAGTCTLAAAIDEGNALGRVAVSLPPGRYDVGGEVITGHIRINDRQPVQGVNVDGAVTVAAGAVLVLDGVWSNHFGVSHPDPLRLDVDGTLVLRNVVVGWSSATEPVVHVGPSGAALFDTSFLGTATATSSLVVNEGRLGLRHSWLMNVYPAAGGFALHTVGAGVSTTGASAIAPLWVTGIPEIGSRGCGGTLPISLGYNAFGDDTCGLDGEGDRPSGYVPLGPAPYPLPLAYSLYLGEDSLIDAIPLGVHGCGSEPWGDWYQQPRPTDGDGDGVLACDIGPHEARTFVPPPPPGAPGDDDPPA